MIGFGQNNVDVKSETEIINYFDSYSIDNIEGIWYCNTDGGLLKIAFIKDNYQYKGTLIDPQGGENGFHFITITPSHSDNIFFIEFFDDYGEVSVKTEGLMNNPGIFEIISLNPKFKNLEFQKVYPKKS